MEEIVGRAEWGAVPPNEPKKFSQPPKDVQTAIKIINCSSLVTS